MLKTIIDKLDFITWSRMVALSTSFVVSAQIGSSI